MNLRPSGYEPDELPGCSTPRWVFGVAPLPGAGVLGRDGIGCGLVWVFGLGLWSGHRAERERCAGCGCPGGWFMRSGGDLLSHVLRRSTIGATELNGRVRDGIGCFSRAVTTRPWQGSGLWPGVRRERCQGLAGRAFGLPRERPGGSRRRSAGLADPQYCPRCERLSLGSAKVKPGVYRIGSSRSSD